ncbi:MAG: UxaA family hydrolase [Peptococcaceae bacterium]|jgi:altronate dehydratase large subunit|nr:UxaA family hydrolase [Peptococcaceae bacterium]MDH7525391.1 UxaA family hydrolase [Peptococcaceae bacterium]
MLFKGYQRPDGSVGVRNIVLIMAVTDCVEGVARKISEKIRDSVVVTQNHGCLVVGNEQVIHNMVGVAENPNVAAVLLLGMGCESLRPEILAERISKSGKPVEVLSCTREGGTIRLIEKGIKVAAGMRAEADKLVRQNAEVSELIVAVKCGGSDTSSGIAANPSVGAAVDRLVAAGGRVIFSEPIEAIGGEEELCKRAVNKKVAEQIRELVLSEDKRFNVHGAKMEFMCKGNILGGLTTIEEKSFGSLHKTGSAQLAGVLRNDQLILEKPGQSGVYLQEGTHYDAMTAAHFVAAGAQIIVFTTGVGAGFSNIISPTIRVCGNSQVIDKVSADIDIDASNIMRGKESIEKVGERIFREIIEVASGKKTKIEDYGYSSFVFYRKDPRLEYYLFDSKR